nr:hypothetical protein [Tanacetum cinerariifolium]
MDDLKLKLDKFQTSSKNLTELLASQTNDKHGSGYCSSESDCETLSPSSPSDRLQPNGGYHVVPPPITGTFMPLKLDLVFHTAPIAIETDHSTFTVQLSPSKPAQDLSHTNRPSAPIIEDWVSDFEDESETNDQHDPQSVPSFVQSSEGVDHLIKDCNYHAMKKAQLTPRNYAHRVLTQCKPVSITAVRLVCAAVPKIMVTRPRHAHSIDTKSKSPIRKNITRSPSLKTSNSSPRITTAQAPVVSAAKGQTGTGKEISNPFMAGSLLKTTLSTFIHFWNTVAVKQSNDVTRLQALVDKKKVLITEAAIRDILQLDDAEGVDCLPNEEIFAELARMGYEKPSTKLTFYKAFFSSQWKFLIHIILQSMSAKRTSWNEFSSAMASVVICLSTGRKFNFSKYIFESLVRNVDSSSKFYMYPRRVEKGCSGVETPLFEGMLVAGEPEEQGDVDEEVQGNDNDAAQGADTADDVQDQSILSPTPPTLPPQPPQDIPSTSQTRVKKLERANKVKALKLRRLRRVGTSQIFKSSDDIDMEDASNQGMMIADLDRDKGIVLMDDEGAEKKDEDTQVAGDEQEDEPEVQEVVEVVTTAKLITEVVAAISESVSAASATTAVVPTATITAAPVRVAAASTRRRKRVVIRDPEEESTAKTPAETKSKDKGKGIMVEEPKPMKKKQQVELDEEYARKLHEELNKDID